RMDPPTMAALTCDYNVIIRNVAVMHTDARTKAEGDMVGLVVASPEYRDDDAVVLRITPNATATEEELEAIYKELYQSYIAVGGATEELEKAIRKHNIAPDDMKVENQALVLTFQAVMGDQVITSDYSYVAMAPIYEKDIHMMYDNPYDEEPAEEVTKKHQHPKTFIGKFAWNETLDVVEFINVTHDYEAFVKFEDLYDVEYTCKLTEDKEDNKLFVLDGSELSVAEEVGLDAIGKYAYVKVNATVGEDTVATGIVKALVVPILQDEYVWNVDLGDVYYFDLTEEFEVVPADPEEAATPKNFVKEWTELGLTADEFMEIYAGSAKFEFPDGTKYEPKGDTINVAMNYKVAFGEDMATAILYPNEKPSIYPDSIVVNFFFNVTGKEDFEFPPLAPAYKIDEDVVKLQGVSANGLWYYGVNQIEHFDTIGYVVPEAVKLKFAQVEGNAYNWPDWWGATGDYVYSWMEGVDEVTKDGTGPFDNETESRVQEATLKALFANGDSLMYDYDVVMVNPFEASIDADEAILYVHGVNEDSLYLDEALYIEDFQGIPLYMNGEVVTPNPYYFTGCYNDDPEYLVPGVHENEIIVAWDYKHYDIKTIDGEHFDNGNKSFEVKKVTVYDEEGESHTKLVAVWNNYGAGLQKPLVAKFKGTVYIFDGDEYIIGKYDVELPITIKTAYEE
ncbi:MAG: hypothetical protein HUJ98_03280, partial [Bacteroidaceae bacterium]|nr:hypothetical protein [Bacteroidaceae bacterium]